MKKIQILGTGCAKCKTLAENARKAVETAGVDAEIERRAGIDLVVIRRTEEAGGGIGEDRQAVAETWTGIVRHDVLHWTRGYVAWAWA